MCVYIHMRTYTHIHMYISIMGKIVVPGAVAPGSDGSFDQVRDAVEVPGVSVRAYRSE